MVDLDWKAKMVSSDIPSKSPRLNNNTELHPLSIGAAPPGISAASEQACSSYEHYLRLPELRRLWSTSDFPSWKSEPILKPALQALEISFRFVSTVVSDTRPYANRLEWRRRLESLIVNQIRVIALVIEDDEDDTATRGAAPLVDSGSFDNGGGSLRREGSVAEVWRGSGESTVVSRTSEASLLPRLATWHKSEAIAQKILYSIECEMRGCPYTLGLGEPNLAGKPSLNYDAICKPSDLHALKRTPYDSHINNHENQAVYATHQILESWVQVCRALLHRVNRRVEEAEINHEAAASECNIIEMIWKLLSEIENLHLLMDPEDFLRLKNQLGIKTLDDDRESFCFRSRALVEITNLCKDLKHKVPKILGVDVDPMGGPRIQEAAMRLYSEKTGSGRIHLLQAMQSVEAALKCFFFSYKQVLVVLMGSLEAKGNRVNVGPDALTQIYLEPTYFPSLDAAKTFLGDGLSHRSKSESEKWIFFYCCGLVFDGRAL